EIASTSPLSIEHFAQYSISMPVVGGAEEEFKARFGYPPDRIKTRIQFIEWEVAEAWLPFFVEGNRNQRAGRVDTYAEDVENGDFMFTGEPLIIASDGTGFEGQHRLA